MTDLEILTALWPNFQPTPLISAPSLARDLSLGHIWLKNESQRPLGNFKSLGGGVAAIRALLRHTGCERLIQLRARPDLPALICASDGNHGLAVATAAQSANAPAIVFLPQQVSPARLRRIEATGAHLIRVAGTYDDAVDAATRTAQATGGLLIADTSDQANPVVSEVMRGYHVLADEIREQIADFSERPTHLFVQAGVGGLAAALFERLHPVLAPPARLVIVEPETADCVRRALAAGRPVLTPGDLDTAAEMLSCGLASQPALDILLRYPIDTLVLDEEALRVGPVLAAPFTVAAISVSGATGLSGLAQASATPAGREALALDSTSRALIILTEKEPTERA